MAKFDVTDEVTIDAPPPEVFMALLNEFAGSTHLFLPYYEFKLTGDTPIDHQGATMDLIVHNGRMTSKLSAKVTKIEKAKMIVLEYLGDIISNEDYYFEPTVDGKTKVKLRFDGRTNRLMLSVLSPFIDIGKGHSEMAHKSFGALNNYLSTK